MVRQLLECKANDLLTLAIDDYEVVQRGARHYVVMSTHKLEGVRVDLLDVTNGRLANRLLFVVLLHEGANEVVEPGLVVGVRQVANSVLKRFHFL